MADPRAPGRMIRKDASNSKRIACLSPRALSLFLMLIPHYSAFGKMNGDPMFIKSEVVPLISWFTLTVIRKALQEIDRETNVKWFKYEGRWYLHSLSWDEHQDLRTDRRGTDRLPSHPLVKVPEKSRTSPGVVPPEVEVEGEVEGEIEKEKEVKAAEARIAPVGGASAPASHQTEPGNANGQIVGEGKTDSPTLNFWDNLPKPKRDALLYAVEKFNSKAWSRERVNQHLYISEFEPQELMKSEYLFASQEVTC